MPFLFPQLKMIFIFELVNSYGSNGMAIEAIKLFNEMPAEMINEATYVSVLNACSHSGLVHQAQRIFRSIQIKTGQIFTSMVSSSSSLLIFFLSFFLLG